MTETQKDQFIRSYNRFHIYHEQRDMVKLGPYLHYLPIQRVLDRQILPLEGLASKKETDVERVVPEDEQTISLRYQFEKR